MSPTPVTPPFDARMLRNALGRFATGVAVITTLSPEGKREGLTANSFSAVSLNPPLVLWSLAATAQSVPSFARASCFAINILGAEQAELSHRFAKPRQDKFEGVGVVDGLGGCPLLPQALAHFECETERRVEIGDHWLFVGRVARFGYRDGAPLAFFGGQYGKVTAIPDPHAHSDLDAIWGGLG